MTAVAGLLRPVFRDVRQRLGFVVCAPGRSMATRRFACIFASVLCPGLAFRVDLRVGRETAGSNA